MDFPLWITNRRRIRGVRKYASVSTLDGVGLKPVRRNFHCSKKNSNPLSAKAVWKTALGVATDLHPSQSLYQDFSEHALDYRVSWPIQMQPRHNGRFDSKFRIDSGTRAKHLFVQHGLILAIRRAARSLLHVTDKPGRCSSTLHVLIFVTLFLARTLTAAADWPMLGGNVSHTFQSSGIVPANPVRLWKTQLDGGVYGSPVARGEILYVAGHDQNLWALNMMNGKVLWSYTTGGAISATPAIAGDTVVVASKDGTMTALQAASGKQKWRIKTGGKILSSPVTEDGMLYFGSNDLFLYALDLADGKTLWRYYARDYRFGGLYASPGLDKERVYIGAKNGVLHAVERQTGKSAWKTELGSAMYDAPLLSGNRIYAGSYDRYIYALDSSTGAILWRTALDDWPQGTPVLLGKTLYAVSHSGMMYEMHASDGAIVWQESLGEELRHSFTVGANGIGVIGTLQGRLIGMNMLTHKQLWERNLGAAIWGAPALADNTLFAATLNGEVTAWR